MHNPEISRLVNAVSERYGDLEYYGSSPCEINGVGFQLNGIPVSFSVHTQDGALKGCFDIQVESAPPGDYAHTDELSLSEFLELIAKYWLPEKEWP